MNFFKRPMLACPLLPSNVEHSDENILAAMEKLRYYSVLATLKKDGIRCIKLGELASRTLKRIPNLSIQKRGEKIPAYFDMELFNPELSYDEIESIVMSREHPDSDKIQFHVLDRVAEMRYDLRCQSLNVLTAGYAVWWEYPSLCNNAQELFEHFLRFETQDGEGICFRTPDSPYKQGRSTLKEQYLVKFGRRLRSEAIILERIEQQANCNATSRNAVGAIDRSSCGANMVGKGTLGALIVKDIKSGQVFKIGTGFSDKTRQQIWDNWEQTKGRICTYDYKPHGEKDLPRQPSWKGFRSVIDM